MSNSINYRVLPRTPKREPFSLSEQQKKEARGFSWGGGCAVFFVAFFAAAYLIGELLESYVRENPSNISIASLVAVVVSVAAAIVVTLLALPLFNEQGDQAGGESSA
jgi:H+/Cl- antiporter ClcA